MSQLDERRAAFRRALAKTNTAARYASLPHHIRAAVETVVCAFTGNAMLVTPGSPTMGGVPTIASFNLGHMVSVLNATDAAYADAVRRDGGLEAIHPLPRRGEG